MSVLDKPLFQVMLSSTFNDLKRHREHLATVLQDKRCFPIWMESDASRSDLDMIDASMEKVDKSDAYVCIIGKRYGQVIHCDKRNPHNLSLTELEFGRALDRGMPVSILSMHPDYALGDSEQDADRGRVEAFRERALQRHRVVGSFKSMEEFLTCTPKAVDDLRAELEARAVANPQAPRAIDFPPPAPPAFHAVTPFLRNREFVGRKKEIKRIHDWARRRNRDPLLVFEAIGGMGKSMVTYHWADHEAPKAGVQWAGRLWYSFYEKGASMNEFCIQALAYIEHKPPRDFAGRKTGEMEPLLLRHLNQKPWLIVMDGLERVLAGYDPRRDDKRSDDGGKGAVEKAYDECIDPADEHLLSSLATVAQSKMLVSTRNTPTNLLNDSGWPILGVDRVRLEGLEPEDAERMMRAAGVDGSTGRMQKHLQKFGSHPLMIGLIAGLVNDYVQAPGNFDRWLADPQGGRAVDVAKLKGLRGKQNHILKATYESLDADERRLLCILALCARSVPAEMLLDLNPKRPPKPKNVSKPAAVEDDSSLWWLNRRLSRAQSAEERQTIESEIAELLPLLQARFERNNQAYERFQAEMAQWNTSPERVNADAWLADVLGKLKKRGLIIADSGRDGAPAQYDLHPMIRSFVRDISKGRESAEIGLAVADYGRSKLLHNYAGATSLADLALGIDIVTAWTLGGHYDQAANVLADELGPALGRLDLHLQRLELLEPFFPNGWTALPDNVTASHRKRQLGAMAQHSLTEIEDYAGAEVLSIALIKSAVSDRTLSAAGLYVRSYALLAADMGKLFLRAKLLALHKLVAEALQDKKMRIENEISSAFLDMQRGDIISARQRVDSLTSDATAIAAAGETSNLLGLEIWLRQKEQRLTREDIDAALKSIEPDDKLRLRQLHGELGELLQRKDEHARAIEAYETLIQMLREAGLPDKNAEARRAISLCEVGRKREALEIALRLRGETRPPHDEIALLLLKLKRKNQAAEHAMEGFKKAWADGPPYANHWDLQRCRDVLKALHRPEPSLPAFSQQTLLRLDFEPALMRLIDQERPASAA